MEKKKIIKIREAVPETAPLSPGVSFRSLLFISGQVSKDLKTGNPKLGTIEEETEQVLSNIEAVLKEAGTSSEHVLKTTVFLRDIKDFPKMNEVYRRHFREESPARSTVGVALAGDYKVEVEAVAYVPEKK
jgi:2-iminobutanoate/2-iminopropanoate deaminase